MDIDKYFELHPTLDFLRDFFIDLVVVVCIFVGIQCLTSFIVWCDNSFSPNYDTPEVITSYLSISVPRIVVAVTDLVSILMICVIGIVRVFRFVWIRIRPLAK